MVHFSKGGNEDCEDGDGEAYDAPGAEPGVDTTKAADPQYAHLISDCEITVVDFSKLHYDKNTFYRKEHSDEPEYSPNEAFVQFLEKPRPDWAKCRWININTLSYDVVAAVANKYKLHSLAIEDLLNTDGRAKVDWYPDHVYSRSL